MTLTRLEAKPQGSVFTGTVEPEGNATWSKYLLPESGSVVWHCVTVGLANSGDGVIQSIRWPIQALAQIEADAGPHRAIVLRLG